MAGGCLLRGCLVVTVVANALTTSTEKALHTVEISSILSSLRLAGFALTVVHFGVGVLVLHVAPAIVTVAWL